MYLPLTHASFPGIKISCIRNAPLHSLEFCARTQRVCHYAAVLQPTFLRAVLGLILHNPQQQTMEKMMIKLTARDEFAKRRTRSKYWTFYPLLPDGPRRTDNVYVRWKLDSKICSLSSTLWHQTRALHRKAKDIRPFQSKVLSCISSCWALEAMPGSWPAASVVARPI